MMKIRFLAALVGLSFAAACFGNVPPPATTVVDEAVKAARAEHKGVLVIFHASWCGWCKQLDKTLEVPSFKSILDKDFVVLHVTVLENPTHKSDENPGGEDLMAKLGGKDKGLPYFAMLNSAGSKVADSMVIEGNDPKPQNMGFPTETVEIQHILDMFKLGNPSLTEGEKASLKKVLEARAAEIKASQHH